MIKSINFGSRMLVTGTSIDIRRLVLSLRKEHEMLFVDNIPDAELYTVLWANGKDKNKIYEFVEEFNNKTENLNDENDDIFVKREVIKYFDNPPEYTIKEVLSAVEDGKFDERNLNIIA